MDLPASAERGTVVGSGQELNEGASLSGHERNHLFLNEGTGFLHDVSGVSGLDHPADGRAVGWLDFDRDGWLDFAVVNANEPTFQLFRNELGSMDRAASHDSIAIRLAGGNRSASPDEAWSNRDGVGARLEVSVGDRTIVRESRAGEGFAAQNSGTLHVGLGEAERADRVTVRWPSGRTQEARDVPAGSLVTFFENPSHAPDGGPVQIATRAAAGGPPPPHEPTRRRIELSADDARSKAPLRVFTTTATWCESCRGELPDVARLRDQFPDDQLDLLGVPVDPNDTPEMLRTYVEKYEPAYRMLHDRSDADREAVQALITSRLRTDVLPASIVTNADGEVLDVFWGLPTVSDLKALGAP